MLYLALSALLVVPPAVFVAVVYRLYLSPHRTVRRRMPGWLIVWCLVASLLVPRISDAFAADARRGPAFIG